MAIVELVDFSPIGFKLAEVAWCIVGAIFVSNWRMRYWNVPVFAILVASTFGYAFISILLMLITLTGKPRYFVCVVLTSLGSALNFLAANLMVIRIFLFKEPDVVGEKPYHYASEGLLAFWMFKSRKFFNKYLIYLSINYFQVCAITMLLDVTCNSPPTVLETHSSTEEEDEDEDGVRRKSRQTETI